MRRVLVVSVVVSWAATALLLSPAAQDSQKGDLTILYNGQPIGRERYEITRTSTEIQARGEIQLQIADQTVRQEAQLLLSADLSPRRYEWNWEAVREGKEPRKSWLRLEFDGSSASIEFPLPDGKKNQQAFEFATPQIAVLDINVFHHFLLLADFYDFAAGGVQTAKVFVPQARQPGEATLELVEVNTLPVDGTPQPVRQLRISTPDNQVLLWITEAGRFVRLQVPLRNVEVVPAGPAS